MSFSINGNLVISGDWAMTNSLPAPDPVPASITATAGTTTTVLATQNIAITSFNPFASVTGGVTPYVYYISAGTLPTGVTQNSSTGLVSGTPTVIQSATSVTFSVVDAYSTLATTSVTVNFTVSGITATAGATTTVAAIQNTAISSFNPFASVIGGSTPYIYYISSGTLPAGITQDTSTGLVSGTPTATYAASNVVFAVKDSADVTAATTVTVNFTVNSALSAVAGGTTTVSGEQTLAISSFNAFTSVSGGYTPYVYGIVSGTLPTGISLNTDTGLISGTPTVAYSSANVVFKVTDNQNTVAGTTTTVNFTVATKISAVAGATTTVLAQQSTAISNFNPFSSVSNGVGAYTYYVSSGTLPTGVTLNASTGQVSGTPTTVQTASSVVFAVKDSLNVSAVTTVTVSFTVRAGISSVTGATTTVSAIQSTAITSFNAFTSVSNGYTPYVYSVSSGTLPAGITLNTGTGLVSGTPTSTYTTASVTFSVTDAQGYISATTTTVSFTVNAAITATAGATSAVTVQQNSAITSFDPFSSVSGGYTPYTYYISSGTLPTGITLDASTGLVSGTPTVVQASGNVIFRVRDSQSTSAATTVTVSFTVTKSPYTVQYLVVAGGGGGGHSSLNGGGGFGGGQIGGGGGGGGGVIRGCYSQSPGTVLSITIGGGGAGGTPTAGRGVQGTPTTLTGATTAIGGGYGGGQALSNPLGGTPGGPGGNGGGGSTIAVNSSQPNSAGFTTGPGGTGSQGFNGGSGNGSAGGPPFPAQVNGGGGGGGGGAGGAGGNGVAGPNTAFNPARTGAGGPGGVGYTWPYTGLIYGSGGGGAQVVTPATGPVSPGGGTPYGLGGAGGGPVGSSTNGSAGSSGVVILSVPTPSYSGTKTGGVTSNPPAAPGQTVITWTTSGSYTV